MSEYFRIVAEVIDESGVVKSTREIISRKLTAPTHIREVGFNHKEQLDILKEITESVVPKQLLLIDQEKTCPSCGKKTVKGGKFVSNFHSIFSDHKVPMQRIKCSCGWSNKFTVEGLFGIDCHPDLLKMQSELGADFSFKRAENIMKIHNLFYRPVNNHTHISDIIERVGPIISNFKCESPVENLEKTDILVAQIDGGHIQPKENNVRSYEVLVAKFFSLSNLIEKDSNHTEILCSTSIASARSDNGCTINKQMMYAALSEGLSSDTVVYALSDGAKNCWSALSVLSGHCAKIINILDWEHISRRFKHVEQSIPDQFLYRLERAKLKLWHGKHDVSIRRLKRIRKDILKQENKKLDDLIKYLENNEDHFINYHKNKRNNLPYTSNVIESAVDSIINTRQKNNKKMSWTREGAHNILQIRCSIASKTWDIDWDDALEVLIAA